MSLARQIRKTGWPGLLAVAPLIAVFGCDTSLTTDLLPDGTGIAERPVDQTVTVAFRNLSDSDAVDVEFFVATGPLSDVVGELFVDANSVTQGVGVAGTGLVLPGVTDVIELPCTAGMIIGTAGGEFLDNETGEIRGRGELRAADATLLGLCGSIVGLTFDGRDDIFTTTIEIRQ